MIELMKYTYLMEPEKVKKELDKLWERYQEIIQNKNSSWEEINEARAILFLTGNVYCEQISVGAIKNRLHLLKKKISLTEFLELIDKNSEKLKELRKDELFKKLERFYRIIKEFKNRYIGGKFYLDEEKLIKKYNQLNPDKDFKIGYMGSFGYKKNNY